MYSAGATPPAIRLSASANSMLSISRAFSFFQKSELGSPLKPELEPYVVVEAKMAREVSIAFG